MMYDTFHSNIEEKNVGQAIAGIAGKFVHVHISENDRGTRRAPDWSIGKNRSRPSQVQDRL